VVAVFCLRRRRKKKTKPAMAMAARAPITGPATQALPFFLPLALFFEDVDAESAVASGDSDDVGEGPGVDELAPGLGVPDEVDDELEVGVDDVVSEGLTSKYRIADRAAHPTQCRPFASIVLVVKTVSELHDAAHAEDLPSR
jgi:hypothetical protein